MEVSFGLFLGDDLLHRGTLQVGEKTGNSVFEAILFFEHKLVDGNAEISVRLFDEPNPPEGTAPIIKASLDMPVHDSEDWESIELAQYTLAFMCKAYA